MSDFEPFYDVSRSYEDNYEQGPFGAFAETLKDGNGADAAGTTSEGASEGALATFLGQPVNLPFGIPAGPLLNSRVITITARGSVSGLTVPLDAIGYKDGAGIITIENGEDDYDVQIDIIASDEDNAIIRARDGEGALSEGMRYKKP